MRTRVKMWRNGPGGKWSSRIIWFEGDGLNPIRLQMEDCEGLRNIYPKTKEEADKLWSGFKEAAPLNGERKPFLASFLAERNLQ